MAFPRVRPSKTLNVQGYFAGLSSLDLLVYGVKR